jgi:hypothetical protein
MSNLPNHLSYTVCQDGGQFNLIFADGYVHSFATLDELVEEFRRDIVKMYRLTEIRTDDRP